MRVRKSLPCLLAALLIFVQLIKPGTAMAKPLHQQKRQAIKLKKKFKVVFLVTEDPDNYDAHKTVPAFSAMLKEKYGYDATVLLGSGARGAYHYPKAEKIAGADLLVVFARRIALPHDQMKTLKDYLAKGKPLIGIRTANHAFTASEKIEAGFEDWPQFVSEIIGCENRGYGPVEPGTDVSVVAEATMHPVLKNINASGWHSKGNVYLVAPLLDKNATVLLQGKVNDIIQPVAWTRKAGRSKVFYTSLGYPTDFATPQFTTLLVNAIRWSLGKYK